MAVAVGRVLDHSIQKYDRRSIGGLNSWGGCLALIVSLQFVAFDLTICKAAQPPTIAELRRDHSKLRTDSIKVQGEFREFRSETVNLAALEKLPSDIGIPLVRSGYVWRSGERFRADFKAYRPDNEFAKEFQHSYAHDGGKVYEFSSGLDPDGGAWQVYDMNKPQAANAMNSIKALFYKPLDALWGGGDVAFLDMLQRPGTKIVPNKSQYLPGGYSLLVPPSDGSNETQIEFEPATNHPFGYLLASAGEGGSLVKVERRVFSIEKEGVMFPSRIAEVASFGPDSGYTQVVVLDLEPLAADSPIAGDFTAASFQNLGSGYQVYNFRKSEEEELAERYERPRGQRGDAAY